MTSAKKLLIASSAASAPAGSGVIENALTIASLHARHRQVAHQLTSAALLDEAGDLLAGDVGDQRLGDRDPARREAARHHPPQRGVDRRILEDQQPGRVALLWVAGEGHGHQIAHPAR